MKKQVISMAAVFFMSVGLLSGCASSTKNDAVPPQTTAETTTAAKQEESKPVEESKAETVEASSWKPEKEIKVIIPFNAGGSSDVACRILVEYLNKYSEVDFVVENLPGSAGQVGMEACAAADPDGYTIVSIPTGWFMSYAMGNVDKTYSDYTPITTWADSYMALVVNSKSEYDNYSDFIEAAKSEKLLIGGVAGTLPTLAEYVMAKQEGFEFSFTDMEEKAKQTELLSNRVDAYVDAFASIQQYLESGDFNCLALYSNVKLEGYEEIPSLQELGYDFDTDFLSQRYSFWGPKDMDADAAQYINRVVKQASEDPECQKALEDLFYSPSWMDINEYNTYCEKVQNDTTKYVNDIFFE